VVHTVDASVWVASLRQEEPFHNDAVAYFREIASTGISIAAPTILLSEVACAVARRTQNSELGAQASALILEYDPQLIDVTLAAVQEATLLGCESFLRSSDALYVWVAQQVGAPLITADREMAERGAKFVQTVFLPDR
jgi:predicted nucleic acid-binding protein